MNTKNILIGGVVAAIVYFLLGYLIYGNLMMDFFRNHPGHISKQALSEVERGKDMLFWAIGVSNLGAGILLAFVFDRSGIRNFGAGLVTGAIVGCLASVSFDFMMYSTSNLMDKDAVVGDILIWTIMSAIAGGIAGMVMGKVSK
jgi:hypothetical protein